jgi:predicted aspartyl protease
MMVLGGHGGIMTDMGIYHTAIEVASLARPDVRHRVESVMVDTGSEYSWLPAELLESMGIARVRMDRFEAADGRILKRPVGYIMVFAGGREAPTIVAFAEPGDMALLGALALGGMNLRVDLVRRELVPAGPLPVAAAA